MCDASTGYRGTEIETDVESFWFQSGGKQSLTDNNFIKEIRPFRGIELFELGHIAIRDGKQVAGIVRKSIQQQVTQAGAVHNQSSAIITQSRQFGKRSFHRRRIARRLDVFHAPVGVKLLHMMRKPDASREKSGGAKPRAPIKSKP